MKVALWRGVAAAVLIGTPAARGKEVIKERGARIGNFTVTDNPAGETWLITAVWMQPKGCERYGSDNSLWFVRFRPAESCRR